MTTPGQLRERVEFQRRGTATDAYGNTVTTEWAEIWTCAARIAPQRSGEERVDASRLTGFQPVMITVRACSAIANLIPDDRIVNVRSGTIYDIRASANFDERKQYIELNVIKRDEQTAAPPPSTEGVIDLSTGVVQPMLGGL